MFATRKTIVLIAAVTALASFAALPSVALAGNPLSSPDAVAKDHAKDGNVKDVSAPDKANAKDSPSVDSYSGSGKDSLPAPTECTTSGKDAITSPSGKDAAAGPDGKDAAAGKDACAAPVEECSAQDSDGMDAEGKPCVAEAPVTETPVETVVPETVVPDALPETVTPVEVLGGGVDEELEPVEVLGGGEMPEEAPPVIGGGGPELPFTGLPLSSAVYGGLALLLFGGAMWLRAHRTSNEH